LAYINKDWDKNGTQGFFEAIVWEDSSNYLHTKGLDMKLYGFRFVLK